MYEAICDSSVQIYATLLFGDDMGKYKDATVQIDTMDFGASYELMYSSYTRISLCFFYGHDEVNIWNDMR